MFRILLVDDSAFDRHLATSILQATDEFAVTAVSDGNAALRALKAEPYDLVITDLNMPEMNGLELLAEVQARYDDLPSIVITAYGSEATAMRALQSGAYSYVPKFHLHDELLATIAAVRKMTAKQREENDLLGLVRQHTTTLSLPNDRKRITATIEYLQKLATAMGLCSGSHAVHLAVALEESLANAMIHGNLEVSSELRTKDNDAFGHLIRQRSITPPYSQRRITVEVALNPTVGTFVIRDEGPGFDRSAIPNPCDPENLLRPSGRGLTLMHAFMSQVTHNEKGNEVTLRLRRDEASAPTETNATDVMQLDGTSTELAAV